MSHYKSGVALSHDRMIRATAEEIKIMHTKCMGPDDMIDVYKRQIYDIAKEAGVSISTVSRVMNNKGNVNAATRKKVEAILDKHDYTPSAIARGMVSKTMNTVAVLTVDIRVPHYARTVYTIEREFSHRGYEVAICNTGGELEETAKYLKTMLEKKSRRNRTGRFNF